LLIEYAQECDSPFMITTASMNRKLNGIKQDARPSFSSTGKTSRCTDGGERQAIGLSTTIEFAALDRAHGEYSRLQHRLIEQNATMERTAAMM
jgi:hypothetical protein